jgi:hypothetical protein
MTEFAKIGAALKGGVDPECPDLCGVCNHDRVAFA